MPLVIACPACQQKMKLPDESSLGKTVLCPGCHEAFAAERFDPAKAPGVAAKSSRAAADSSKEAARETVKSRLPEDAKRSAAASRPASAAAKSSATPAKGSKLAASGSEQKAKPKSKKKDDEVLEAVEIVEEEDEWANLPAAAPRGSRSQKLPSAPPVVGKKKKSGDGDGPVKPRLKAGDGELSIGTHRLLMLGTGLIGALLMMGVWAGLTVWLYLPSGWMAWLVGIAVGCGVRLGASKWDYGLAPGVSAAVLTLVAILGGKAVAHKIMMGQESANARKGLAAAIAQREHENHQIQKLADELAQKKLETDPTYNPYSKAMAAEISDDDDIYSVIDTSNPDKIPEQYNPELWKEASEKWAAMPDEEKEPRRKETATELAALKRGESVEGVYYADAGRVPIFHIFDLIWAGLAVTSAFRLATGMMDD